MKAIDGASALLALRICVRVVERFKEGFAIFLTLSWCNRPFSQEALLHQSQPVGYGTSVVIVWIA